MHNWQKIIWREWRYTSDLEFAQRLFEVVADTPTGWGARLSLQFFSIIAGASLGMLIALPVTFSWSVLQYLALAGGVVGMVRAYHTAVHSRDHAPRPTRCPYGGVRYPSLSNGTY